MAYEIRKSDGTVLLELADGFTDNTTSSLVFIGKNVSKFGEIQNNNLLHLLENFSALTEPANKITGQLWFDKTNSVIKVFNNDKWQTLSVLSYSASSAGASSIGNLWYDTANNQLSINTGTGFKVIGPESVPGFGTTRLVSTTLKDLVNISHPVIEITLNNEIIGIISNVGFDINSSNGLTGFPYAYKGITFKNGNTNEVQLYGWSKFSDSSNKLKNENGDYVSAASNASVNSIVQRDNIGNIYFNKGYGNATSADSAGKVINSLINGSYITGSSFDGSVAKTWAVDATTTNTASKVVARDASGNIYFNKGYGTATSADSLTNSLINGSYITGSSFDGSVAKTWAVDATTTNTASKVVARDGSSNIAASGITVSSITANTTGTINGTWTVNNGFNPTTNGGASLGTISLRWGNIYAQTADANTVNATTVKFTNITDVNLASITQFDTDTSLSANSHSRLATQRAIKQYIDDTVAAEVQSRISADTNLQNQINGFQALPTGTVLYTAGISVPAGFLALTGQSLSKNTYANLYSIIGGIYGQNSTTFNLPDLRGEFIRSWDNGRGVDVSRSLGTAQSESFKSHGHLFDDIRWSEVDGVYTYNDPLLGPTQVGPGAGSNKGTDYDNGAHFIQHGTYKVGGEETRPRNIALQAIIKY